ncbi:glycosyltransferase [Virgibacillus xinjiangensis]|uniref:Glycosyltransferase n=1 Tax=Virgibacillus xinjiangensis TaxID=393090 RepID=A0ABV7CU33_9BACI
MKVCMVSTVHSLFDIRIFYKELKTLKKQGYEVSYIVPHDSNEVIDGIKINKLPKPKNRLQRIFKVSRLAYIKALKENAHVYHFHDPELIFVGLLLRVKGKKVIYDIHENNALNIKFKSHIPLRSFISKVYRGFELLACRFFVLILAEESYKKYFSPKFYNLAVVQNFPDTTLFPPSTEYKEKYIVYLGGVSKIRGIEEIIEALYILSRNGMKYHFKCIGHVNESLMEDLQRKIEAYNLQEQVEFLGQMRAVDAYEVISKASLGLAILKPHPNYFESYPTKVFEYMTLGIPFITSDFKLYRELVNETNAGCVTDPNCPQEIAEKIRVVISNEKLNCLLGENGKKHISDKYNWKKESEKLLKVYQMIESELHDKKRKEVN